MSAPPARPGTYALLFELAQPVEIQAGRLGAIHLPAGFAVYVGSAFGPGGLRARIQRHLRPEKRPHWHIDHLTVLHPPDDWLIDLSGERLECIWAQHLAGLPGAAIIRPGFGSSDCRFRCPAHLLWFRPDHRPDLFHWLWPMPYSPPAG